MLEFIPKLLTLANGDSSNEANKPKWWPEDVPWEANLNQFSGNNEVGLLGIYKHSDIHGSDYKVEFEYLVTVDIIGSQSFF